MEGPPEMVEGDGHERHDLLLAAARQSCQKAADGLNPVLGIARDANDGFRNGADFWGAARGWDGRCLVAS